MFELRLGKICLKVVFRGAFAPYAPDGPAAPPGLFYTPVPVQWPSFWCVLAAEGCLSGGEYSHLEAFRVTLNK